MTDRAFSAAPETPVPETPKPPHETRLARVKGLVKWLEVPLAIASAITIAWSLLLWLLPQNDIDTLSGSKK